jgi:potassium-dependent mechanosensitive channel
LDVAPGQGDLAKPIGQALMLCAWPLLALGFFRQVVRPEGLADCHFQWSDQSLRTYRRTLRWLIPIVVLCSFALATLEYLGNVNWKGSLGRPFLILMLLALAVFFRRILNPRTNAKVLAAAITTVWSNRANYAFYALGMIVPGALLVLDLLGFHFTAIQLLLRLAVMVALVSGLFLVHDTVLRALVLTRRKLAIAQATERRKAAAATRADANESNKSSMPIDDPSIDVSSVAEQTRSLLRSLLTLCIAICTWLAWVDVLPALGIFRTEKLWEDITLADAMLAAIVFVMTFLAARNIPGVLQLTLLHRLKVHAGESHAITSIARYLILLIGCLYGFSTLGLGWGKLQWLAAGISVGLGFGLQEIFANFISGLIILLERPIRIGDLVTVKEVDGYVTRIRMRATTIRDYNRKELIIPNKEFVTGSVVNWTLSDSVARLIVRVGVAYGSDLDLTRKLLLEIAAAERLVLPKPKTKALFRGFGDSTLDFELRIFIGDVDDSPEVLDRILSQIDARFKAAKIEIAFPQRDLHLRTVTPLIEALGQRDSALRASPSDAPERPSELT